MQLGPFVLTYLLASFPMWWASEIEFIYALKARWYWRSGCMKISAFLYCDTPEYLSNCIFKTQNSKSSFEIILTQKSRETHVTNLVNVYSLISLGELQLTCWHRSHGGKEGGDGSYHENNNYQNNNQFRHWNTVRLLSTQANTNKSAGLSIHNTWYLDLL